MTRQSKRKGTRGKNMPQVDRARAIIRDLMQAGKTFNNHQLQQQYGIAHATFDAAVAAEAAHKEAVETSSTFAASLSQSARRKLDAAIRAHKHKLDLEFELRCREECRRWLNDVSLPQYAKEITALEHSICSRRGVMDRTTYRKILSCLHPDRVTDPDQKKRYEEAFQLFTELEKRVLNEEQSPTQFRRVPRTYEELMALKAKVRADRQAKRAGKWKVPV